MKNHDIVVIISSMSGRGPLFRLGHVCTTHGALDLLDRSGTDALILLQRHQMGDWGSVNEVDMVANTDALKTGCRLLSAYELGPRKEYLWIITEADRSSTTLLLPEEY